MSGPASARGLFRAMGRVTAPAAMLDIDTGGIVIAEGGLPREKDDFYPTPPEPIRALLAAERPFFRRHVERLGQPVWEPCCGDGALMAEMRAAGFVTVGSDLVDRGADLGFGGVIADVFSFTRETALSRVIITNPPFGLCNGDDAPFIAHALDTLDAAYLALLLPVNWWAAAGRAGLWQRRTPSIVHGMRWRIDFTGQGAPPMVNGWFVWDVARPAPAPGVTLFACLDRHMDARQEVLL